MNKVDGQNNLEDLSKFQRMGDIITTRILYLTQEFVWLRVKEVTLSNLEV